MNKELSIFQKLVLDSNHRKSFGLGLTYESELHPHIVFMLEYLIVLL